MLVCKHCANPILQKTRHSRYNVYCSMDCQVEFRFQEKIFQWKQGIIFPKSAVKKYLALQKSGCWTCGITAWQDSPIVLELEHVDGNSDNNEECNLSLLCPNCHSQTPTYKSKNRGKGRFKRMQRRLEGKSF